MRNLFSGQGPGGVERIVQLALEHLGTDVVYLAEFIGGRQVYRALAGDAASFGMRLDDGPPLDGSYCALMVQGMIPNVIPDSRADARVRELPTTAAGNIGAYLGVPLYLPGGELYGSLCALNHAPTADLNPRDVKFLSLLGEFAADELERDRRLALQHAALQAVLDAGDIQVACQPIVDLLSGQCLGVEALARFAPELGSPDEVFAKADEVGLRMELETLAAAAAVQVLPYLGRDHTLAVNLSPDAALALMPRVEDDRALHQLTLEITEHAAVTDYALVRERLQPLRERGLRLAIDDAGAGYASLRHIVELQPDIIKIDRALVAGIDQDPARRSALTTFVLLALDLGGKVVVEGVETRAELATVAALGVDAVQGYLLARPSTDRTELARWVSGVRLLP